jgi:two-component system, cell cycle response regulator
LGEDEDSSAKTFDPVLAQEASEGEMDTVAEQLEIVIADDSPIYRKLVSEALSQENYTLHVARNGGEAINLVSVHQPAVVITDWEMPDVNGIELCERIRRELSCFTYIILLTSKDEKNNIIKGLAAGADDYLTKPFHAGELLARVRVGKRIAQLNREVQTKNLLLEELALTDSLTGLPNRRAIEQWATRELKGAARHGFPFWIVMADLDRFKSVNDTYGHDCGDLVLKRFAEVLKTNTRASNMCGRIGGEEFVIALSHISKQDVLTATDRIRRCLESEQFNFGGRNVTVTASFGIAGVRAKTAELNELLREADVALYTAKRSGRNRIEFAPEFQPELRVAVSR